jgi:hypothetical protein
MNAKIVKNQMKCNNCGHIMTLNAWGIPTKHQDDGYADAIEKARIKIEKINKECDEADKKNNQRL